MNQLKPLQLFAVTLLGLITLYVLATAIGWIDGRFAARTVIAVLGDVVNMFRPHKH